MLGVHLEVVHNFTCTKIVKLLVVLCVTAIVSNRRVKHARMCNQQEFKHQDCNYHCSVSYIQTSELKLK